jgi:hypothetical protein
VSASSTLAYWLFVPEKAFEADAAGAAPAVGAFVEVVSNLYNGKYQLFGQTFLTKAVN